MRYVQLLLRVGMIMSESTLSDSELTDLEDRLGSKRQELAELIKSLREVTGSRRDCAILDIADSASLYEMQRRAATLIGQHEATLEEVDAALARIREGRYGISQVSGEPIGYERLAVIPWARVRADEDG